MDSRASGPARPWITRALVGIVLATFFSDFSHEAATAVLPLYLASIGLGPAALGAIEGVADFLVSLAKLAGGAVGHRVERKRPLAALGYLVTSLATAGLGLAGNLASLVSLRSVAWIARGFRGPLRDHLLAEAVESSHYGRAYGLERAGDMLGAVAGPTLALLLLWFAVDLRTVLLWTIVPGLAAAAAMFFLTRGIEPDVIEPDGERRSIEARAQTRTRFPRAFWLFLAGVFLFGLGDFSRTFLVWLASRGSDPTSVRAGGVLSTGVLLYAAHNLVAALSAYPVGHLGDRRSKLHVLVAGYGLGVLTNALLAATGGSVAWLVVVVPLSAVTLSVEETLEKAAAAELLPRELRSLGFGLLAGANALGDMLSSLYVGILLEHGHARAAFALAAACGALGVLWMLVVVLRRPALPTATA